MGSAEWTLIGGGWLLAGLLLWLHPLPMRPQRAARNRRRVPPSGR